MWGDSERSICDMNAEAVARFCHFLFGYFYGMDSRTVVLSNQALVSPPYWLEESDRARLKKFVRAPILETYPYLRSRDCVLRYRSWGCETDAVLEWIAVLPLDIEDPKHIALPYFRVFGVQGPRSCARMSPSPDADALDSP
jgi:hypothetical protein